MNELQIRLSADISALQSALTKAKQTIKGFEDSTNKESEKGNVGFKRKIGLIEQLTQKAKGLRTALEQATNEKDVARYNAELEDTSKQMTRLNALGRTLGNSTTGAAQGFNKLAGAQVNANGVAVEFSRIIQDAPFGIIGIGNNLQQLTANFAQVSKSAGGAGAAIKASLASLISPANLLVLGISAVTAAFTAYQMGAFDFLKSNEEAKKSLNELTSEIKSASANSFVEFTKIDSLRSIIEDETLARDERLKAVKKLQSEYPKLFGNADKELLLNGKLTKSYDLLKESILAKAKASIGEQELQNLAKQKEFVDQELKGKKAILAEEERLLNTRNKLTSLGQSFSGSDFEQAQKRIFNLKNAISDLSLQQDGLQINIEGYTESVVSYYTEFENLLDGVNSGLEKSKVGIEDIFALDSTDFVGQVELINKALTQGVITPDDAQKIKDLISESLEFTSQEDINKIADSLGKTINAAIAELTGDIKEVPIKIDFQDEKTDEEKIKEKIAKIKELMAMSGADTTAIGIYTEQLKELQNQWP